MTLAFERFTNDATGIDRYIDSMENNRDQFLANVDQVAIEQDHLDHFAGQSLSFLVITEDWCIDSVQFVPVLVRLARENENLDIRVLRRDEHRDLADNYKNKMGYQPIPVIIVFDDDGNELGHVLERPEQTSAEMAAETRRFQEANPHLDGIKRNIQRMPEETQAIVKAHNREWRLNQLDRFAGHLLNELRDIIDSARDDRAA